MRAAIRALALTVVLVAAVPAYAQAATTVGSSLRQRANLYIRCPGSCTAVQTARPGGLGLSIPTDGIVTRWRVRAATLGMVRLRILRAEPGGGYSAIGQSDWFRMDRPHEPGHDILYEFPAQIVVHAGDVMALDRDAKAGGIFHSYGDNNSYAAADFSPALADDAFDVKPTSSAPGRELLMNLDVEKDDDGDTFGDESQDNCPTVPNDQSTKPCSTPTPEPTGPTGPTSTPIDVTPQPHNQGSAGPPVAGERPISKSKRRHRNRRRARSGPPRSSDPQRTHGRKPGPRSAPRKPAQHDTDGHARRPSARPTPVSRERSGSGHDPASPRPKPPTPRTPSSERHDRQSPRQAPRTQNKREAQRHRTRTGARPAPHAPPEPGWRHHSS
jgi:hypothetical protein